MREEQETRLAPPCAHDGCGLEPADHMGWALRHLYVEPGGYSGTAPEDAAPIKEWEVEGVRILLDAYNRWEQMPHLRLRLGRAEAYATILALQAACTRPGTPPFMVESWHILGRQLAELVADTPEIMALIETGWHRENDVLCDRQEPEDQVTPQDAAIMYGLIKEAEEQPAEADATAHPDMVNIVTRDSGGIPPQPRPEVDTIDVTRPYCYRIDQTDRPAHRPNEDFMLAWGSCRKAPHPAMRNALDVATYQAAVTRIEHNYLGPLRVAVWQQRQDEHFRQEPPEDAFVLDLVGRHDDLSTARELVASVEQDE